MMMRKSIRCCISCILPCGALDVIRIVHSNGRVEEISGATIKASEIMKAHPKHVLKKPSSPSAAAPLPNIVVVPPDALLQRGKIYFLMPLPSPPPADKNHNRRRTSSTKKKARKEETTATTTTNNNNNSSSVVVSCDRYLTEIMSEKISTQRDRRRGRVAVWRPHLESISESSSSSSPPSTTQL
ncbi:uncharacterized protein LOC130954887 [Arachis stenosperma]|uniref:uncharacterized protein LOC130954887 n=1 Tax=Arachis stenosperma TaxID=217475 RepID=UPI0025AD4BD1|nr:uncharacterized protein LOC130954887 [Arachis stenosperma]